MAIQHNIADRCTDAGTYSKLNSKLEGILHQAEPYLRSSDPCGIHHFGILLPIPEKAIMKFEGISILL